MIISYFHHAGDNMPAHAEVTWEQLALSLSEVRQADCTLETCKRSECPHKNGPSWSAARYIEGKKRGVPNVLDVHAFIIDLDHVDPDELPDLLTRVEPYRRIITSSHSDRLLDRCLRVVLDVSRPVLASEWYRFWAATIALLDIPADKQVKDPSRLYYLPSRSKDACHDAVDGTGYAYESSDGLPLDVDAILASLPEVEQHYTITNDDFEIPEFTGAPSIDAMTRAVTALAGAWPDSGRNTCQLALCGALARAGWPVDLITDFVEAVCEMAQPGNGDRPKRAKAARASVAKVQAGEMVAGWPTVEEFVDPDAVKVAMDALGMGGPKFDQNFVNAFSNFVHDTHTPTLVNVTRDDIESTLIAVKRRLARAANPKKIKEAKLIGRALAGEPFTDHADEDQDLALQSALKVIVKYAPRGFTSIMLAEYLTKSRPDIPVDTLCQMIDAARGSIKDDERAELPADEFQMEVFGPRAGKPSNSTLHNFELALSKLGVKFYYDEFARKKILERQIDDNLYREVVADSNVIGLMFEIERKFEFRPPKEIFFDFCTDMAHQNKFHPVRDYLDGLQPWDGVPRLERWLIDFGGAEDTPYVRAVSRLILVAAVRRARQPGCKFDEMLILESPQGSYKSTAIKTLCPNEDWFADNFQFDSDTKKMMEQTAGKWIVEAGELRGMSARDQNTLKAYLSSTSDESRMSYEREPIRVLRQFIIIGSTNDTQYLKDHTGDRRYWPVKTGVFDIAGLASVRDQLWAEASHLDLENPAPDYIRLDPSLYDAARHEQAIRKVDNVIKITLEEHLSDLTGRILVQDTWKLVGESIPSQALQVQIANAMMELGWERLRVSIGGKRPYYYLRGSATERQVDLTVVGNVLMGLTVKPKSEASVN